MLLAIQLHFMFDKANAHTFVWNACAVWHRLRMKDYICPIQFQFLRYSCQRIHFAHVSKTQLKLLTHTHTQTDISGTVANSTDQADSSVFAAAGNAAHEIRLLLITVQKTLGVYNIDGHA